MAETTSENSLTLDQRARKFHEGWMYHQPTNGKVWTRYWMVLRGNMLFIFLNERSGKEGMKGTLTLGPDTELRNLPPETKKKGFKFELTTTSNNNERKINRFKFDKENERDVWKSFVVGISVGIVPSDVHLLPGQLKDVHEAIGEVRNRPPPLPDTNIPRPKLLSSINRSASSDQLESQGYRHGGYNGGDAGSDDSGSFTSHVTRKTNRSESLPNDNTNGGIQNLRQLMRRQMDLANKELGTTIQPAEFPHKIETLPFIPQSPVREPEFSPSFPTPPPPLSPSVLNVVSPAKSSQNGNFFFGTNKPQETVGESKLIWDNKDKIIPTKSPIIHNGHSTIAFPNNNKTHMFYLEAERNLEPPQWFFDIGDDSRLVAEQILTMGRRYGNVLMRTSTSFGASGKYVLSMRREVAGGTKLDHYEVIKMPGGFKINVDNKHSPMKCLSEVMDFFVTVAGPGTAPMKCNNLDKVFNRVPDNSVPQAPPLSPTGTSWSAAQTLPSSVHRRNSAESWSSLSSSARPGNHGNETNTLSISGDIGSGLREAVYDMNKGMSRNSADRTSMTSSVPAGPAPPPPVMEPIIDYHDNREYVNIPDVTMPPRNIPSETLQRTGQYGQPSHGIENTAINQSHYRHQQQSGPPAPPFSPPGNIPPPPPISSIPPPPPISGIPPPPPMSGSGPPAAPSLGDLTTQFSTARLNPVTPPQNSNPSYNTTPGAGRFGGSGSAVQSLQNELLSKLKFRKDEIYATATILKSNYD